MRCGLFLVVLPFAASALIASELDATRLTAWFFLPVVMTMTAIFLTTGVLFMSASLVTLTSKPRRGGRAVGASLLFAFGALFAWSGGAGLYAFLSAAPLGRS